MPDDLLGLLPSFSFPGSNNSQNVPQALRQRIALAMLMQKRKAPSTFGEGLSAIGDSLGEMGIMRRLEAEAAAGETAGQAARSQVDAPGGVVPAGAPPASPASVPPVQAAKISSGEVNPMDQTPVPPSVQEGGPPVPPRPMFRPELPTRSAMAPPAAPAGPLPPATPMVQGTAALNDPVRTNPDGTIAGNLSSPQVLPPPTGAPTALTGQPGGRPSVADYGQKLALAPTPPRPPIMAQGGAPPVVAEAPASLTPEAAQQRRDIGVSLLKQQMRSQGPQQAAPAPPMPPPPQADASQSIRSAPPAAPPIAKMPPPVAGPQPAAPTGQTQPGQHGYVLSLPPELGPAPSTTERLDRIQKIIQNAPPAVRESVATSLAPEIQQEQAKLVQLQKEHTDKVTQRHELARMQETQRAAAIGPEADKRAQEADIASRFGGPVPYQQFVGDMSKAYDATQQLSNTLPTLRQAKQALAQSYTGSGAELKLDAGKMLRNLGVPGDYAPEVATEMLQSRMKAIAGGMIKSTVGSQNISDADREFVEKAYSGTIKMEPESIRKLLGIAEDTTIRSINRHNDRLLSVANDPTKDAALRNQYSVPMQYGDDAVAYLKAHPDTAAMFDKKFGKGHAKAVLSGGRYGE